MRRLFLTITVVLGATLLSFTMLNTSSHSQQITGLPTEFHSTASNLIIPQSRSYSFSGPQQQVQIANVTADVRILEQVATTTMDVGLTNPTGQIQQQKC